MLGPVDLVAADHATAKQLSTLHWVICGGESGSQARPMHPAWARSLRDQCAAAGVPFFLKQWGEWAPSDDERAEMVGIDPEVAEHDCAFNVGEAESMKRVGKGKAGRLLDGVEHNGFPEAACPA